MSASLIISAALVLATTLASLRAAPPLPPWYGESGTTRQGYTFNSSSQTPASTPLENSYGAVISQISLGAFSDGWQDPMDPIDLSGVAADGAWDLGISGNFAATVSVVPSAAAPGSFYRIDFQVYSVSYSGITALPGFSTTGIIPSGLVTTQALVALDPMFPGSSWVSRTWTGSFNTSAATPVTFNVTAPSNNVTVLDTVEVFTRYTLVPEPGPLMLSALAGLTLLRRRR